MDQSDKSGMQVQAAGIPWFDRDDYESFRRVLPERHWHATYDEWEAAAQQGIKRLEQQGLFAVKSKVRSEPFVAWCRAAGRKVDTDALLAYSNEFTIRAYREFKGE